MRICLKGLGYSKNAACEYAAYVSERCDRYEEMPKSSIFKKNFCECTACISEHSDSHAEMEGWTIQKILSHVASVEVCLMVLSLCCQTDDENQKPEDDENQKPENQKITQNTEDQKTRKPALVLLLLVFWFSALLVSVFLLYCCLCFWGWARTQRQP